MISLSDIQNKEFTKTKFKGYKMEEVHDFVEEVIECYQYLNKENRELKEKINLLQDNLNHYKTMEQTIQNALLLAEKTAQETKKEAYEKADIIQKIAEEKAKNIILKAGETLTSQHKEIDELKTVYASYKGQIKKFLELQLTMLDKDTDMDNLDMTVNFGSKIFEQHTETEIEEPSILNKIKSHIEQEKTTDADLYNIKPKESFNYPSSSKTNMDLVNKFEDLEATSLQIPIRDNEPVEVDLFAQKFSLVNES